MGHLNYRQPHFISSDLAKSYKLLYKVLFMTSHTSLVVLCMAVNTKVSFHFCFCHMIFWPIHVMVNGLYKVYFCMTFDAIFIAVVTCNAIRFLHYETHRMS